MNYMNYVDDSCMFSFTYGQAKKIRQTALTVRSKWNLEDSQVEGLRGGSPWVSVRITSKDWKEERKNIESKSKQVQAREVETKEKKKGNVNVNVFPFRKQHTFLPDDF